MSLSNKTETFAFRFNSATDPVHDMTHGMLCDATAENPGFNFHKYPCSVTIYQYEDGDYWLLESDDDDAPVSPATVTEYEWDIKVIEPGKLVVYTDCPAGSVIIKGWEYRTEAMCTAYTP